MFTGDDAEARHVVLNTAAWHGRLLVINRDCAAESTGHGSPLPAPGPVLANYGLENLRFIEPVGIGDTIRVKLVVK